MNVIHYDSQTGLQRILALCTDCRSYDLPHEILENAPLFKETLMKIFSLV